MKGKKRYYSIVLNKAEDETQKDYADVYIYGDIVSWTWFESDVSSHGLAREIKDLDVETINIYINSYGGEVAEGLAIYNALRRHKATVKTIVDGFACSAASVVFMAGEERIMSNASLLFIHNAWLYTAGDANDLRKDADDLDVVNQTGISVYMEHINISEDELKKLLDAETWLSAEDALEKGFATKVISAAQQKVASQNVREKIAKMILEPPAHLVAEVSFDEAKLQKIVAEQIAKLEQRLILGLVSDVEPEPLGLVPDVEPEPPEDEPELNNVQKILVALGRKSI